MNLLHQQYHRKALEIAGARAKYGYDSPQAQELINEFRQLIRYSLAYDTKAQRNWQARAAKRVLHGNHYDSWIAREKYVTGRYNTFDERSAKALDYANAAAAKAGLPRYWHKTNI